MFYRFYLFLLFSFVQMRENAMIAHQVCDCAVFINDIDCMLADNVAAHDSRSTAGNVASGQQLHIYCIVAGALWSVSFVCTICSYST